MQTISDHTRAKKLFMTYLVGVCQIGVWIRREKETGHEKEKRGQARRDVR